MAPSGLINAMCALMNYRSNSFAKHRSTWLRRMRAVGIYLCQIEFDIDRAVLAHNGLPRRVWVFECPESNIHSILFVSIPVQIDYFLYCFALFGICSEVFHSRFRQIQSCLNLGALILGPIANVMTIRIDSAEWIVSDICVKV